jgi:hypothetical protein
MARECLLDGMQLPIAACQALDRLDVSTPGLDGQDKARPHGPTIHDHGARSTHSVLAAKVRPGEPEPVSEKVSQSHPDIGFRTERDTVDANRDYGAVNHRCA